MSWNLEFKNTSDCILICRHSSIFSKQKKVRNLFSLTKNKFVLCLFIFYSFYNNHQFYQTIFTVRLHIVYVGFFLPHVSCSWLLELQCFLFLELVRVSGKFKCCWFKHVVGSVNDFLYNVLVLYMSFCKIRWFIVFLMMWMLNNICGY